MNHLADLTKLRIAKLYAGVPPEEIRKFRGFRDAYPYRHIPHAGIDWPYLTSSGTGTPLLILTGALTHPDLSWQSISHFGEKTRILVPAYPAARTMDELCGGIAAILRHEGIENAHVMGGSYGGFVAQVFVRRFPAMTRSLILSHTAPPDSTGLEKTRRMWKAMSHLPNGVLRRILGRAMGKLMPADSASPAALLLTAMFHEVMDHHLSKADLLAVMDRTLDFSGRNFTAQDLAGWPGKILLVLADDDPASPEKARAALQTLYPEARLHVFHGTGHITAVTNQTEYLAVMDEFLGY